MLTIFLLLLLAYAHIVQATPPRVGLVLGGGGAKGLAHIGVLKYLEEHQIPVDFVVGTSMGAIAGGLYVQGVSPQELERLVLTVDWLHVFTDAAGREFSGIRRKEEDRIFPLQATIGYSNRQFKLPSGIIQGQRLMPLLRSYSVNRNDIKHFNDYALPFRATATDIETGELIILEQGDIALAMRASMAIPGVFAPVSLDNRFLVDGGITNNLPVDVALAMGASQLIVVDVGNLQPDLEQLNGPFSMMEQAVNLMIRNNTSAQLNLLREHDIHLAPELIEAELTAASFDKAEDAIRLGYEAAARHSEALLKLASNNETWLHYQHQLRNQHQDFIPSWFSLQNESALPDDLLWANMVTESGTGFNAEVLNQDIERIYGLGYFEQVDFHVVWDEHNNSGIELRTTPRSWGPDYLSFGLTLEENFDTQSNYRAAVSYLRTAVNKYGAEFQTDLQVGNEPMLRAKYWQPLRRDARAYSSIRASVGRNNVNRFLQGELLARAQISRQIIGIDLGTHWQHTADIRISYDYGSGQAKGLNALTENVERATFDSATVTISALFDSLNSVHLPQQGTLVELSYATSDKAIGADLDYQHFNFRYLGANTWGDHTLVVGTRLGSTTAGTSPFYDRFSLGGFMNMSGYELNEFSGQHVAFGQLVYLKRLSSSRRFGTLPIYIGAAAEAGHTWDRGEQVSASDLIYSGSLLGVITTPLGAIYIGISRSNENRTGAYLAIGRPF